MRGTWNSKFRCSQNRNCFSTVYFATKIVLILYPQIRNSTTHMTLTKTRGHFWVYQFIKRPCTFKKTRQSRWVAHLKPHYEPIKHIPVESEVQLLLSIHICTLVCILIVYIKLYVLCTHLFYARHGSFLVSSILTPPYHTHWTEKTEINLFELYYMNMGNTDKKTWSNSFLLQILVAPLSLRIRMIFATTILGNTVFEITLNISD